MALSDLPGEQSAYRVLARKYRPQNFDDLIGQEAMVRTLRNAFASQRIHQAYIFTGVRGVGKTTTARILARALNYETETVKTPQIDMPVLGLHCEAIMESRHVDVIEMDAASNTSIANVREIIEAARYKPVSARMKVYIIDEVHMLSTAAFNGLLKTLEEPPPHVKFLFATTEIRKVPVTVLSRCQRFDLRRIETEAMTAYLVRVAEQENVSIDADALALIARASEGSMRDALSLMDQSIAHGGGRVDGAEVRIALALADRSRMIDLFEALMRGDIASALTEFDSQHDSGADPIAVLNDLAEFVHIVTRMKLTPEARKDRALSESERQRGAECAERLPMRALSMAWQVLLKGLTEVQTANRPRMAAEMVLVRLAYAADLPGPAEIIREWRSGEGVVASSSTVHVSAPAGPAARALAASDPRPRMVSGADASSARPLAEPRADLASLPQSFDAVVALAAQQRDIRLQTALERDLAISRFEPGRIEFVLEPHAEPDLPNRLHRALFEWTGQRWAISVVDAIPGAKPLTRFAELEARRAEERHGVQKRASVQFVLKHFPGAEIIDVQDALTQSEPVAPPNEPDDEAGFEPSFTDEDL
jgi:DNA polymerase-3 subunit gamma/tau